MKCRSVGWFFNSNVIPLSRGSLLIPQQKKYLKSQDRDHDNNDETTMSTSASSTRQLFSIAILILICANTALCSPTGLRNLGNTCYLNSQLQCQFHIPLFRNLISSNADETGEDSSGLQSVFESMSKSRGVPGSTYNLCRKLGINVYEQQDAQEFWKLLLNGQYLPDRAVDLYQGGYEDYIIAQDGSSREKRREETFLDLSLDVQGRSSVLPAINGMFGTPELLQNSEGNGWRPEKGAEPVDALKGSSLKVQGLPSILQLHLKRFSYDWQTDSMSKINDRFEFSEVRSCYWHLPYPILHLEHTSSSTIIAALVFVCRF